MTVRTWFRIGTPARLAAAALCATGIIVAIAGVTLPGVAGADSGTFTYSCSVPGLGLVPYLDQVQGSIPAGLTAGSPFSVSGLEFTSSAPAMASLAGQTVSGSVTTTLLASGATPASESVTLNITPAVGPSPPATETFTLTATTAPTFTATGGPVVISTGPAVSAFDIFVNGSPQSPFSCTGPSPGAAIAFSSPAGALVADAGDNTVSVVDTASGAVDGSIPVGQDPTAVAISPNGQTAYVTDAGSNAVSVINTNTGDTVGAPIAVGTDPVAVAIAPGGKTAYVANYGSGTVTPITLSTGKAGPAITLSKPSGFPSNPSDIVISPDGSTAYVSDAGNNRIHILNLATGTEVAAPTVFSRPVAMAMTPDGSTIYVNAANEIGVISTTTHLVTGYFPVGTPGSLTVAALGITPDGSTLLAATTAGGGSVVPVATGTNTVGPSIPLPDTPTALAFSPDSATAYVTLAGTTNAVVPVTLTGGSLGNPVPVGDDPAGVAVQPDQAPVAALTVTSDYPGAPSTFDASASTSTTHPIVSYQWDFGDGSPPTTTTTPVTTYPYAAAGTYVASVTVTDSVGTSTEQTFTGQTVSNSGAATATASQQVVIVPCNAGEPCSATVNTPTETSSIMGTSETDALLASSIGQQVVSCGSTGAQSEEVTTYATTTFTTSFLQATLTVHGLTSTRGFSVCYEGDQPFIDAQGQSVLSGTLPVCAATPVAPCLVSATEVSGSVVALLDLLPGDPRFWTPTVLAVTSFSPKSAVAGQKVTVVGQGLTGVTAVSFGRAEATFTVAKNGKKLSVVVPAGATNGPITIVGATGTTASTAPFTLAKPTIKPVKASPGHSVTIKGKNIPVVSQVTFGGLVATVTRDTAKSVTVTVPAQAQSGTVTVVTPGGTATNHFTAT